MAVILLKNCLECDPIVNVNTTDAAWLTWLTFTIANICVAPKPAFQPLTEKPEPINNEPFNEVRVSKDKGNKIEVGWYIHYFFKQIFFYPTNYNTYNNNKFCDSVLLDYFAL